jgi:hypothetical protein
VSPMFRSTPERTLSVVAPHFTASVVLKKDNVVRAAPILSYMIGWSSAKVDRYAASKGWMLADNEEDK